MSNSIEIDEKEQLAAVLSEFTVKEIDELKFRKVVIDGSTWISVIDYIGYATGLNSDSSRKTFSIILKNNQDIKTVIKYHSFDSKPQHTTAVATVDILVRIHQLLPAKCNKQFREKFAKLFQDLKTEKNKLKNDKLEAESKAAQLQERAEKEAQERAEMQRQLEFERAENERLHNETQRSDVNRLYNTIKSRAQPNGWIYIVANKESFKQTMFKIGKTDDLNHRLASYHTGHQGDDRMQYLAFWHVNNADIYERICLWILQHWRVATETPGARVNRESNSEIICMPFANLKHVMDLAIHNSIDAAFDEIYSYLDDPEILINSGLAHREAINDANLPTYRVIHTPEYLAAENERQRAAAIPKFETQAQRDAADAKPVMIGIVESYVNFALSPTPPCNSATTIRKKHIVPVVKLREWIIKNQKAHLPSAEEFKSYVINLCANHPQLTVVLKKPVGWKSVNGN